MDKKIKVVILCGGMGTRLREETEFRPKPMVEIGGLPILWHIMKIYSHYGYSDSVLCLGYKGDIIRQYFLNYDMMNRDFTVTLGAGHNRRIKVHDACGEKKWKITLCDTGEAAMTGARVKRIQKHIDTDLFMLTYGDGVADINIDRLVSFHRSHGRIGTVTGVHPVSRFGELIVKNEKIVNFSEKPQIHEGLINGGFFVFDRRFFNYLEDRDECVLERAPLEKLSAKGQLMAYVHSGFWQCMDTYRDLQLLNQLWKSASPPWKIWSKGGI